MEDISYQSSYLLSSLLVALFVSTLDPSIVCGLAFCTASTYSTEENVTKPKIKIWLG